MPIGLKALVKASGSDEKPLDAGRIAYRIAPRLNAAGRVGDPYVAVELLISDDPVDAEQKALTLCEDNTLRQQKETEILKDVETRLAQKEIKKIIIEKSPNWHNGIIGIVASKVAETYSRPCILFCTDGETAKGSARSRKGINIYELLSASATGLSKFGGHAMAAGLTVKEEDFEAFKAAATEYADNTVDEECLCAEEEAECVLSCADMTLETYDTVKRLEPFGAANPTPAFALRGVTVEGITPISQGKYTKMTFGDGAGNTFSALSFTFSPDEASCSVGDKVNIICTVDENVYRGVRSLSSVIRAIELSDVSYGSDAHKERKALTDKYSEFKLSSSPAENALTISRDDVGAVYKQIKFALQSKGITSGRLSPLGICRAITRKTAVPFNYAKLRLCLDAMTELQIITHSFIRAKAVSESEVLSVTLNPQRKTSLLDSPTYVRASREN
jgi:single-stranded-DNA-specific exonuclease